MLVLAVVGAVTAWRRPDRARPDAHVLGALSHRATSSSRRRSSRRFPTRRPGTCCRSTPARSCSPGSGSRGSFTRPRPARSRGALAAAFVVGVGAPRMAGLARVGDLRGRPAQSRTSTRRPSPTPSAWRRASASSPRCTPTATRMQVSVIAPPYEQWPLPWYLRTMPNVGYWTGAGRSRWRCRRRSSSSSMEHTPALDGALGDRYVSEFFGLRPEVLLALYVERGLWDRFLARAAPATRVRCGDAGRQSRRCGRRPLWHCGGRRARRDASRTGPGRALLQRGGPPRPRGVPAVRRDAPGRAARDGGRWERGRHGGDPRAHARGGARVGDRRCGTRRAAARPRRCAPASSRGSSSAPRSSGSSTPTSRRRSRAIDDFLAVLRGASGRRVRPRLARDADGPRRQAEGDAPLPRAACSPPRCRTRSTFPCTTPSVALRFCA